MKRRLLAILTMAMLCSAIAYRAQAITITIDPEIYATGANITNIFRGATLSILSQLNGQSNYNPTRSDVYVGADYIAGVSDIDGYLNCWSYNNCYWNPFHVLEIAFSEPTRFVEFDARFFADEAWLVALDSDGNILGCIFSAVDCTYSSDLSDYWTTGVGYNSGSIRRPQGDIARVLFGAWDGGATITRVSYSVPEPGTLVLLGLGLAGLGLSRRCKA